MMSSPQAAERAWNISQAVGQGSLNFGLYLNFRLSVLQMPQFGIKSSAWGEGMES
jgi:hypothetical protein